MGHMELWPHPIGPDARGRRVYRGECSLAEWHRSRQRNSDGGRTWRGSIFVQRHLVHLERHGICFFGSSMMQKIALALFLALLGFPAWAVSPSYSGGGGGQGAGQFNVGQSGTGAAFNVS